MIAMLGKSRLVMRLLKAIAAVAALLAVAVVPVAAQEDDDGPMTARWVAIELSGKPVEGPTLDYTTDRVSGTGGCNRFNGPISIEDDAIQIGPIASTKMMCEGKSEIEAQYFAALEAARSFVVEENVLTLRGEDGHDLLKFKK